MSEEPEWNDDFRDIVAELLAAGAEFLIVGAHALAAHGVPRATGDLDLWVRPTADNAERVFAALQAYGAPLAQHGVAVDDFGVPGTVYQLGLPPRRIDVMTSISGVEFDEGWSTRCLVEVGRTPVAFLGRDALLANKEASGRDKDRLDAKLLRGEPRGE